MTGLLVSVRNAQEAAIALQAGVDLLDVKEPNRGALGRADDRDIAEVVKAADGKVPVSAALGELIDYRTGVKVPAALSYAKLGLACCRERSDWPDRWAEALAALPVAVAPVAVCYADWRSAAAPSPEDVLQCGARLGCQAALLDTFDKLRGTLFEHCDTAQLARWIAVAREKGMLTVMGGSLSVETVVSVAALAPDYVAVRRAACRGSRRGAIDTERIAEIREALIRHRHLAALPGRTAP